MKKELKKLFDNKLIVYDFSTPARKKVVKGFVINGKEVMITFNGGGWPINWKWYFLKNYKFEP